MRGWRHVIPWHVLTSYRWSPFCSPPSKHNYRKNLHVILWHHFQHADAIGDLFRVFLRLLQACGSTKEFTVVGQHNYVTFVIVLTWWKHLLWVKFMYEVRTPRVQCLDDSRRSDDVCVSHSWFLPHRDVECIDFRCCSISPWDGWRSCCKYNSQHLFDIDSVNANFRRSPLILYTISCCNVAIRCLCVITLQGWHLSLIKSS